MSIEIDESRQQALIALLKTAGAEGIDVTELVRATERYLLKDTAEPYTSQITKQIRIAHAMAGGTAATPEPGERIRSD